MKTHIDHIAHNSKKLSAESCTTTNKVQLRRLKQGDVSRCQIVEQIACSQQLSIAQLFVRPGADSKPWCNSSSENFPKAFNAYINASGLTDHEMGLLLEVSSIAISNYRKGEFLPNLERIQTIADTLGIEVGDLFLPVRNDIKKSVCKRREDGLYNRLVEGKGEYSNKYSGFLSHRVFLPQNIIKAMRTHGVDYATDKMAIRIAKGQTVRLNEVEDLARRYGLTIGNAFIRPGVQTVWYAQSRAIYMPFNMQAYREDMKMTKEELASKTAHCSFSVINNIETGYVFGTLAQTQDIANTLKVEISDLFLPIDGLD